MNKDKLKNALHEIASNEHLIARFENDMIEMYRQMQILEIVFDNLKGSMRAISGVHKIIKGIIKE